MEPSLPLPSSASQFMVPLTMRRLSIMRRIRTNTANKMAHKMKAQLQTNAVRYLGASSDGYKNGFQMEVELERQFIKAMAMARFMGGRGTQLDIHDKMVVNRQYNDGIMMHIAK